MGLFVNGGLDLRLPLLVPPVQYAASGIECQAVPGLQSPVRSSTCTVKPS